MSDKKKIYVYADWIELKTPTLMGVLSVEFLRGKEIFSFEYTKEWLNSDNTQILDPDLGLYSGIQYLRDEKSNFGLFLDSSPDRWGRVLMKRREAILAKSEKRPVKTLRESDFLLGVYDLHRMGALRFKLDPDGEFLDNNKDYAAPPWTSIRELEYASLELEKSIDRNNQVVEVNPIIQMEGYSHDRYVVYDITKNQWGITYKLINLRTKDFNTADIIRPLKEKFGIGYYYDSENPQFMDSFEVAGLLQEAQQNKKAEKVEAEKERIRVEKAKKIGRQRFKFHISVNLYSLIQCRNDRPYLQKQQSFSAFFMQKILRADYKDVYCMVFD